MWAGAGWGGRVKRDDYARLKAIVAEALARPPADRPGFVAGQCGSGGTTRIEVESLLAAAVHAAALYEDPTLLVAGDRVTLDALERVPSLALSFTPPPAGTAPDAAAADAFTGTERYAVRRRIGVGGMGVVYEVDDRDAAADRRAQDAAAPGWPPTSTA